MWHIGPTNFKCLIQKYAYIILSFPLSLTFSLLNPTLPTTTTFFFLSPLLPLTFSSFLSHLSPSLSFSLSTIVPLSIDVPPFLYSKLQAKQPILNQLQKLFIRNHISKTQKLMLHYSRRSSCYTILVSLSHTSNPETLTQMNSGTKRSKSISCYWKSKQICINKWIIEFTQSFVGTILSGN